MSSYADPSLEKDELTETQRSTEDSRLADKTEDDTEVSTSAKSSAFDETTKVAIHATIQMEVEKAKLHFEHRFEYGRDETLKKLVDHCREQLEFDTRHARPSVEVKAREVRKVEYEELSNTSISDVIDDSTMELNLNIDFSECPKVLWPFILAHTLAMRSDDGRGSSADEVLQIAIAHFGREEYGFSKTFQEDFERWAAALKADHLGVLVPILIQIVGQTYNMSRQRIQAGRILMQITNTHGNSLNRFALQLTQLVRRLFVSCGHMSGYFKRRPCCVDEDDEDDEEPEECGCFPNMRASMDSRDCQWAAEYFPLLFQYTLGGSHELLLDFWPLLKEEMKQAEREKRKDLIPHLLSSVEQCLQHVNKGNVGNDEIAKMGEVFEEEFDKYKEELAKFKEERANREQDEETTTSFLSDVIERMMINDNSDEKVEDGETKKTCSFTKSMKARVSSRFGEDSASRINLQLIRSFPRRFIPDILDYFDQHDNALAEKKWKELANFVVERHTTDIHKKIALNIIERTAWKFLDQDEAYHRRFTDFIVNVLLKDNRDEELRLASCDAAVRVVECFLLGGLADKRAVLSQLMTTAAKKAAVGHNDLLWRSDVFLHFGKTTIALCAEFLLREHRDTRSVISDLMEALLKVAEEEVFTGSFVSSDTYDVYHVASSLMRLAELPDAVVLSQYLPRMLSLCKAAHKKYRDWSNYGSGAAVDWVFDPLDYGRMIRLRIERESIDGIKWPADKSAFVPSFDFIDSPDVVNDTQAFGTEFNGKRDEIKDSATRDVEIDQSGSTCYDTKIARIECSDTFNTLSPEEKRDLHESIHSFYKEALAKMLQVSPGSVGLFIVLFRMFKYEEMDSLKVKAAALGISSQEWLHFLHWAAARMTIGGRSFPPIVFSSKMKKLVASSAAATEFPDLSKMYYNVEEFAYPELKKIRVIRDIEEDSNHDKLELNHSSSPFAVNKKLTSSLFPLVEKVEEILKRLPWDRAYDREDAMPPFNVVDVFATGTNYNLGHNTEINGQTCNIVVNSNLIDVTPLHMVHYRREDTNLMKKLYYRAQFIGTVLHELFGHPSGKKPKTFGKDFGEWKSVIEETRAYAVELILCCDEEVMKTAGCEGDSWKKIKYIIWVDFMNFGLVGLRGYDFDKKKWKHPYPHSWARYMLLSVVYEAGEDCLLIEKAVDADGEESLCVILDESKIDSVALPAICDFVKNLQCFTATGNVAEARRLLEKYVPGPEQKKWVEEMRKKDYYPVQISIAQPNTVVEDGETKLIEYPATPEGIIDSVKDRFAVEWMAEFEKKWRDEMTSFNRQRGIYL